MMDFLLTIVFEFVAHAIGYKSTKEAIDRHRAEERGRQRIMESFDLERGEK